MNTTYAYTGAPDECPLHWPNKPTECAAQHNNEISFVQHTAYWYYKKARRALERGRRDRAAYYQQVAANSANEARLTYQLYYPTHLAMDTVLAQWASENGHYTVTVTRTAEGGHRRDEAEGGYVHAMQYTPSGFLSDEGAIKSGEWAAGWQPLPLRRVV